jgi:hypothetical protein
MTPEEKIQIVESSLRCFLCGVLGLWPLLGAGFAVLAIRLFFRVGMDAAEYPNPARAFPAWGFALGVIGLFGALAVALPMVATYCE